MHPAVHIANPSVWPRGDPGNGRLSWDMASILATATRRVARPARPDPNQVSPRGAHRRRAGDGFALAPDAERALAAEEGWLSERGGSCPTPP